MHFYAGMRNYFLCPFPDSFLSQILFLGCVSEEEVSKWCVIHTFDIIFQHVWLCIEVQRSQYIVFTDKDIFCCMECFHTLCLIRSSFCCIDLCIVIRVRILSIVVSAACTGLRHLREIKITINRRNAGFFMSNFIYFYVVRSCILSLYVI